MDAYFERLGPHTFRPTEHVGGAWNTDEQHIAPMLGLIVAAVEAGAPDDGKTVAKLTVDILGPLAMDEFEVHREVIRPGRTIELVEVTVTQAGRPAVAARVWRLAEFDTQMVVGGLPEPMPGSDGATAWPMGDLWPGGFIASVEARAVVAPLPGRARTWLGTEVGLIAGEAVSDLARFVGLIDAANGVAVRASTDEWMWPNVDLSLHLFRQPAGRAGRVHVGLDTTVVWGPTGHGLTTTVLHDLDGPVGTSHQMLTIRPR